MPDLKKMLEAARKEEFKRSPKKIIKGIRPDKILRGEISLEPSSNEEEPNWTANNQQLDSKHTASTLANNQQLDSKHTAKQSTKTKLDSKQTATRTAELTANNQQLDSKHTAKWGVDGLSGKEADLIQIIYLRCKNLGSLSTEKINSEILRELLNVSTRRLCNLVERLTTKKLLLVTTSRCGKGGWRQFTLPSSVYQDVTLTASTSNWTANNQQITSNWTATRTAVRTASAPSSSSSIDLKYKTTTTGNGFDHVKNTELISTNPNWEKIDHESLKEIGFNASHVAQVIKQGLHTPQSLQDSIYAFKFDLNANKRGSQIQGSALNYFMGILRKGPYAPPQNYESPEDKQLREYLEAKEKLLESKRIKLNRIKEIEFEEWMDSLSKSKRDSLAPMGTSDHLKRTQLRNHFDEHIWELKKEKLVGDFESSTGSESSIFFESTPVNKGELPPLTPP